MAKHTPPPGWINPLAPQQPLTSSRWIIGALAGTLLFAALCVYITFCLLFWQGQWQLVFQPSRTLTTTPASVGLPFDNVQFDATETGVLQLSGWWIPAVRPTANTLLLLHGSSGSLSDTVPRLQVLHRLGVNVFAFDYRGFGKSINMHPSEKSTYEDAGAAFRYLTETRHIAPSSIILDGVGIGAAIAAETARRQRRTRLLPIRLLFHDRFDAAQTLAHLKMPTLMLHATDPHYLHRLQTFLSKYFPC
jgi:acetyl esterase/lipase